MSARWTAEKVLSTARAFQPACVMAAGADLGVFTALAAEPMDAASLAARVGADTRAMTVLLDALAAMGLLAKRRGIYRVPPAVAELLTEGGAKSVLPMVLHQANCLRRWAQLPVVVKTGQPAKREASIRGEAADQAAFIGAMHTISGPVALGLISGLELPAFHCVLDIGGGSGTWTMAFLRARPDTRATLFDLPEVISMARERLTAEGLIDRVTLVPGDFYTDSLPGGADLVWLSAIAHQNSREQNRALFGRIRDALAVDGVLLIRDVVMESNHTKPAGGAMFAVNMLVATEAGGTYSLAEYREDLQASGFHEVSLIRRDPWMSSVVCARRA